MQQTSLRSLFTKKYFHNISKLKFNQSGYPFLTFIKTVKDGKTLSTNLYFSKKSAELMKNTFNEGDSVASALAEANIVLTENDKKELRYKIALPGESNYESTASLESIFGEVTQEFPYEEFAKEFQAKEVLSVQQEG